MTASSGLLLDVSTQKDWQRRCRPVKFCYICGGLLATHDKNVAISAEHIIPRSVLDHFLQPGMCSWKATISVHACCETSHKRDADTFLNLLGRVSAGDDGPPTRADALALVKKLSVSMLPGAGSPTPSIAGVADSYVAVNRWVQGVYAVVFGEYLPLDPDWQQSRVYRSAATIFRFHRSSRLLIGSDCINPSVTRCSQRNMRASFVELRFHVTALSSSAHSPVSRVRACSLGSCLYRFSLSNLRR